MRASCDAPDGAMESAFEFGQGATDAVLEDHMLEISPDEFDRIEFGGIGGEINDAQSFSDIGLLKKVLHEMTVVAGRVIPDDE